MLKPELGSITNFVQFLKVEGKSNEFKFNNSRLRVVICMEECICVINKRTFRPEGYAKS
jgi:hypothetical protein